VRRTPAVVGVLAALAFPPTGSAAQQRGFTDFRPAADRLPTLAAISPPPRLHRAMRWYHSRLSTRSLLARADEFGPAAIVGLRSMRDLAPLRRQFRFARVQTFAELRAAEVSVTRAQVHDLLASAARDARIRYVEPLSATRRLQRLRNDPLLRSINPTINAPYEWEFASSRVDRALNISTGSPNIVVGIVDSGVADVPDLRGKVDSRWYYMGRVDGGDDTVGHGTAVASIIAANNDDGFGMAGFGGASHIISFRDTELSDESIAIATTKLVSLGVRVINISAGGRRQSAAMLLDALTKAANAGVLVVSSAGNDSLNMISHPAADLQPPGGGLSYGLAVGAANFDGTRASFSNQGERLSLLAPGNYAGTCYGVLAALSPVARAWDTSCYPTFPGDDGARYTYAAGTSFAAPEVAGAAALVWSAAPNLKNFEVATILKRSARHDVSGQWNSQIGWGRLDVAAALEDATGRSSADVLGISGFSVQRGLDARHRLRAQGEVAWADGVAPDTATATCAASVNGVVLRTAEQSLSGGTLSCSWETTAGLDDRTLTGTVVVTDGPTGVTATLPFTAKLGDLTPPIVRALHATGKWGGKVALPFGGNEDTGVAAAGAVVRRNGKAVASVHGSFAAIRPSGTYSLAWKAPKRRTSGAYSFCVRLVDRGGNQSPPSCASISLG
jgi:subtilisin family serine protease